MPICASRSKACCADPLRTLSVIAVFNKLEEGLGMAFFALTTLLVLVGAIARTAGSPLIWAIDIAQASFVWACVLGADIALRRNVHIEIDILVRRFPRPVRRALAGAWLVVIVAFLACLVYFGVRLTELNVERPMGDTGFSYAWVTAAIPAGALLMLATALRRLWRGLRGEEAFSLEGHDGTVL
jgi:TRAP-type C4-dicarboxylate transport system permease small subunit